ncbi:hypothetical protein ACAG25_05505 [Mycobacterium sp. pV006]|uniref:hypothetical protein n=1 Tax=Mycobacterium sp. pV006 TaxID=3238983 RepID=UPI00351AB871
MAAGDVTETALDELYTARPEDFTTVRTRLAKEAKRRGDTDGAARISGCRKPTVAAWVVNTLALQTAARADLADLGARLRDAHAAMDGTEIRALTAEQRKLIEHLSREALRLAAVDAPTAALRDDVTGTLQAAVADPEVAARLGRLTKAEQWSGFGEFGAVTTVSGTRKAKPPPREPVPPSGRKGPDQQQRRRAHAELLAARRAKSDAEAALSELQADLSTARLRHQDAQRRLEDAEAALTAAQDAYDAGKRVVREAAEAVADADAKYRRTE